MSPSSVQSSPHSQNAGENVENDCENVENDVPAPEDESNVHNSGQSKAGPSENKNGHDQGNRFLSFDEIKEKFKLKKCRVDLKDWLRTVSPTVPPEDKTLPDLEAPLNILPKVIGSDDSEFSQFKCGGLYPQAEFENYSFPSTTFASKRTVEHSAKSRTDSSSEEKEPAADHPCKDAPFQNNFTFDKELLDKESSSRDSDETVGASSSREFITTAVKVEGESGGTDERNIVCELDSGDELSVFGGFQKDHAPTTKEPGRVNFRDDISDELNLISNEDVLNPDESSIKTGDLLTSDEDDSDDDDKDLVSFIALSSSQKDANINADKRGTKGPFVKLQSEEQNPKSTQNESKLSQNVGKYPEKTDHSYCVPSTSTSRSSNNKSSRSNVSHSTLRHQTHDSRDVDDVKILDMILEDETTFQPLTRLKMRSQPV